jgi:hypothetical protein
MKKFFEFLVTPINVLYILISFPKIVLLTFLNISSFSLQNFCIAHELTKKSLFSEKQFSYDEKQIVFLLIFSILYSISLFCADYST